jgi:hypothetical protein
MQTKRPRYSQQVAAEVRAVMARNQVSVGDVADALGLYRGTVRKRLSGDDAFDIDELAVVAAALGVSVHNLLPPIRDEAVA